MVVELSNPDDELRQLITDWADSVIESAKQLMFDGEAYLIAVSGLPWYRQSGDTWVDHSWWIETAQSRYERYRRTYRPVINELEILTHHCPEKYRDEARQRIDQWYEESAHDPEYWWDLATVVYPEHSMFQDLHQCPENYSERVILAELGYEDVISDLREEFLTQYEHQDWFWVSEILSCIASIDSSVFRSIVSESELQQIRRSFCTLASKELLDDQLTSEQEFNEELGQLNCIRPAVKLGWQDVINSLSENHGYLGKLGVYDILWWSLTDKRQLVKHFIIQASPHISRYHTISCSEITGESMALAIAWKRAMSVE